MNNDIIVNGYLVMWATISSTIWIAPLLLSIDTYGEFKKIDDKELIKSRILFWVFMLLTILDILTAPLQIAIIDGLLR